MVAAGSGSKGVGPHTPIAGRRWHGHILGRERLVAGIDWNIFINLACFPTV